MAECGRVGVEGQLAHRVSDVGGCVGGHSGGQRLVEGAEGVVGLCFRVRAEQAEDSTG
jgi:hypothetical protein